jgi:hypothetical protein
VGIETIFEEAGDSIASACETLPFEEDETVADPSAVHRRAYLKARLHLAKGERQPAAAILRKLVNQEKEQPEPLLLLSRVLREDGRPVEAETALRIRLQASPRAHRLLWDEWLDVSFRDLKLAPAAVLDGFPRLAEPRPAANADGPVPSFDDLREPSVEGDYARDVRWLLEELTAGRSIRIRCGGEALTLPGGEVWGRDCFLFSAHAFDAGEVEIHGTDRPDLYRRARMYFHFYDEAALLASIPVPPGKYRVQLHFAETQFKLAGYRRYDLYAQGQLKLKDFEILDHVPLDTAWVETFETEVLRGPLELRYGLGFLNYGPIFSALEITRLD